jgi:putative drug exporter of the RND superfamily
MKALARIVVRRRRFVVAAWLIALVAIFAASSTFGGDHRVDYTISGSDSARAQAILAQRFPEAAGEPVLFVFEGGTKEQIDSVLAQAANVPHVSGVSTAATANGITVAPVQLDATAEKVPVSSINQLMEIARKAPVTTEVGGSAVQNAEAADGGSEQAGMGIALVILLIAFGSVLAAALPLVIALFAVGAAVALVPLLSNLFMVPDWAVGLVTMICIGIGIDYALFIVTRYRAQLAEGAEPEDAVVTAVSTAGRAVLFAGGTVVISLLGMCTMGLEYLYGTAAAMVTGVLVVLAASLTLLPALLGFAGRNIDRLRLPFLGRGESGHIWTKWSHVIQRRSVVTGGLALIVLIAFAAPFTSLRFGYPDAGTGGKDLTSRRAYDLVTKGFGQGANSPFVLAVETNGDIGAIGRLSGALENDPGVANVLPVELNSSADTAVVLAIPKSGPQAEETVRLLHHLRDDVVPGVVGDGPAVIAVGGSTAAFVDESEYMAPRLPIFIGAVIALSFVLLLVVFRSVLVALKAAVMNVLAIGAAYGVMAVALQGGWLGQLIGIHEPTPIPAWAPMMMFAVLFGLSMDYEVFLLSRIREEYGRTHDNAGAVAVGMARTGRVITAAAAIMATVFGAFVLSDQVLLKVIGLGLATAVLLDATVVRMVLVPSTMDLLGDRNWWLPRWLDRVLPHIDLEGRESVVDNVEDRQLEWSEPAAA